MQPAPNANSHTTTAGVESAIHGVRDLMRGHDLESDGAERGHGERRPEPRCSAAPRGASTSLRRRARRRDGSWARRGRIAIEQRERDDRGRDDTAEGDERRAPSQRRDEPGVHRVEDHGAPRVAGAEDPHGRAARAHEPAGDDRRGGMTMHGDARGAQEAEAEVVLRRARSPAPSARGPRRAAAPPSATTARAPHRSESQPATGAKTTKPSQLSE